MNIKIDRHSSTSLIQQIYQSFHDQINTGDLDNDMLLPSIRGLAKQLEVSMVTVSKAYSLLEQEGSIHTVRGKGTFVVKNEKKTTRTEVENTGVNADKYVWQDRLIDYLPSHRTFDSSSYMTDFLFDSAKISPGLLAGTLPAEDTKNVFRQYPNSLFSYSDIQGDWEFRKLLEVYFASLSIKAAPEEIMVTSGIQQGIDLISRTFLGRGDIVIVETPTFSPAIEIFRSWGATVLAVPLDEEGMRVDALEEVCSAFHPKIIYTNPSFQNPTGVSLSRERREKLIEIAKKHQILVIEDDSWSELYFHEEPALPVKSLDESGHVIFLKGFSKWLSPGCRIAALTANGVVMERLLAAKRTADLGSSLFNQKVMETLLHSENLQQHIDVVRTALANRLNLMQKTLSTHAPAGVSWTRPDGGLNLWLTCPSWFNTDIFHHQLKMEGIYVLPGSACFPTEPEYNHIRLSFSFLSEEKLEKGMILFCQLLTEALSTYKTSSSPHF